MQISRNLVTNPYMILHMQGRCTGILLISFLGNRLRVRANQGPKDTRTDPTQVRFGRFRGNGGV